MPMRIEITIDNKKVEKILLNARKTIDGNIIISDHPEVDILLLTTKNKCVALPKEEMDDEIYDTQKRMFDFLIKKGVIDYSSVQGGNLFMSMEGTIPEADKGDRIQYTLYCLAQFIEKELPFYKDQEEFEQQMEKSLLEPEVDEYTDLNTAEHHAETKGSLPPRYTRWGIGNIYRI
jgi:hypothetical protein